MSGPPARREWVDGLVGPADRSLAEALAEARDRPDSPDRVARLERVALYADALGDIRYGVEARLDLIDTYLQQGEAWRLYEPVRHCHDLLDRVGGPPVGPALRRYQRHAVEALLGTPRVALTEARSMLEDLARRSAVDGRRVDGDPSQVVAELHCRIADHLGDEPAARRWYDRWRDAAPDPAAGCPGCLPVRRAELLAGWGDPSGALAELAPALDGTDCCTDQPEAAAAVGLLPWLRCGEPDRAARAHVLAYRRHRREPTGYGYLVHHLRFCALTGNPERGLAILAEQLPRLDRAPDDRRLMEFAAGAAVVCAVAVEAGLGGRTLRRPAYGSRPAVTLDVAALGHDLLATATALAGSFDARNGTGHQSGRIAAWLAERPSGPRVSLPLPLSGDGDGDDPDTAPPERDEPTGGVLAPLRLSMIKSVLDDRGDDYTVDETGTVLGRWGGTLIQFRRLGDDGEILQARVAAVRRLPAARLAEAYVFCNAWNHDRLLPRAFVHDLGTGELVLAGDVTTDLAYGVAPDQLAVLIDSALTTGVAYADAVAALP
ncbi:YbjN domain-containing protein [Micromonospora sp. SH-82]|uniref:YbjN domain-containing protein n=1 Tax=Micromonospora sp. SH-82 TaxID=3132938 RepID=UPI003EBAE0FE